MSQPPSVPFGNLRIVAHFNRFFDNVVLSHQIVPRSILRHCKNFKFVRIKVLCEEFFQVVLAVWKLCLMHGCASLTDKDTHVNYHVGDFFLRAVNAPKVESILENVFGQVCFQVWVLLLWRVFYEVDHIILLDWLVIRRLRWLDVGLFAVTLRYVA